MTDWRDELNPFEREKFKDIANEEEALKLIGLGWQALEKIKGKTIISFERGLMGNLRLIYKKEFERFPTHGY